MIERAAERIHQRLHRLDAGVALVVALHNRPRRGDGAGAEQHILDGRLVLIPLLAVAPILVRQLPGFVRRVLSLLEAAQLLLRADLNPEFGDDHPEIHQLPLELVDLTISALPLLLRGEALDALDQHPAIPTAVEDQDLLLIRGLEAAPKAPQIMVRGVLALGGRDGENLVAARIQLLGDPLDIPALAARVPALVGDDERALLLVELEGQLAELELVEDLLLLVCLLLQLLV